VVVLWLVVILVAACGASMRSNSVAPTASPSPATTASSVPVPASPVLVATPGASPAGKLTIGSVVVTVVDRLRVRSAPRISQDSFKLEPVVPQGAKLYVLDGPESASGYTWYQVVPLSARTLPSGWVAIADRDGMPWVEPGAFDCPVTPRDLHSLASLAAGVGLACFPQVPITVRARIVSCNCDIDGAWYTPSWFYLGSGPPGLLVEPDSGASAVSMNPGDWFVLNLDPNGEKPETLPVGKVVVITGVFDHPAAASCTRTDMDSEPVPSQGCRLAFAVTKLVPEP
jgi:hypothetical protein